MKKGLLLIAGLLVGVSVWGQTTIFLEKMGTVTATTTLATHESNNGFDNDSYTMTQGGATNPADVRKTSSRGTDGADDANLWFTSTNADYGFAIEGINTSGYSNLQLSFYYRKETGTTLPTLAISYWDGSAYQAVSFSFPQAANATTGWYQVTGVNLPAGAVRSDLRLRFVKSGTTAVRLDEILLQGTAASNDAPVASNVTFTGTLEVGQLLTGDYDYSDTESNPEGTSTFRWLRSDDASGTNEAAISGATSSTYMLQAADLGKFISFEVTPVASAGTSTGTAVASSRQGAVNAASNDAPVASNVTFTGTLTEGQTLTGDYDYSDTETDAEGTSTFRWLRSDDASGTNEAAISGATISTYVLQAADINKYISFEVTPVAQTGTTTGTAVASTRQGAVAALPNDAPVASDVTFTGTLTEGQTLTGSYTYSDTESNPQGTSTFRWLRSDDASGTNEAAISGATSLTYVLTAADVNKYLSFEVTPVASAGTLTGTAVASSRQGAVIALPALIYDEPFNYTADGVNGLAVQSGQVWFRLNTGDSILVTSGSLSYNGLQSSVGNKVSFGGVGSDNIRPFTSRTTGTVYFSLLLNVSNLGSLDATGGYLAGLARSSSEFGATLWLKKNASDFQVGIAPRTGTATFASGTYPAGSPILVVGSYEMISGTGNDVVKLWINPAYDSFGDESEPTPDVSVTNTAGTDMANIDRFFLRQDSATETPDSEIDELKIGTTWAAVTPAGSFNTAPVATNVTFTGTLEVGQLLTGDYDYSDGEGDTEGTSTFRWTRSDDALGTNEAAISGATSLTYTLQAADLNKYISFEVTPVAQTGNSTGTATPSTRQGAVNAPSNNAPVASNVTFTGTLTEGQTLTGDYDYSDTESNPEGTSTFRWLRSDDASGTNEAAISGATSSTYVLQAADISKYISFEVTPVASAGTLTGTAVSSTRQGAIAALPNDAPVASEVTFTGTLTEGQTLTGSYTYSDTESNPQGTSTFRWLRSDDASGTNEAAISGATASTYVLQSADVNKYISFEVTPVASAGTLTGSAVASSRQGAVIAQPVTASVVINKYQNGTPDKVELLVIQDDLDMQGMIIKDFSSSMGGDGGGKYTFANHSLWASVPAGTLIVLSNDNTAADTDPSGDFVIQVGLANTTYFTSGGGTFDIATTEMVMIKAAGSGTSGVTGSIHALAGGTAGAQFTAAPQPKLLSSGTSASGNFVYANNSTSTLADYKGTDATGAATGLTFGAGNNASNTTYITSLRPVQNPSSGTFTDAGFSSPTTLTGGLNISGTLTIGAQINTGGNTINLGSTGSITGETPATYVIGTIQVLPTLNGAPLTNVGGLGIDINPGAANMGVTTVIRETGSDFILGGSVAQRWTITPTTQPGGTVTVTLTWPDENNAGVDVDTNPILFKSQDGGTSWTPITALSWNTAGNPNTVTFEVTSFSEFTIGDNDSPLPIELVSWQAVPGNQLVVLKWKTASEINNAGFEIFRSTSRDKDFIKIASYSSRGQEALISKGSRGGAYEYVDAGVSNGLTYFYRLSDVSYDGERTEHAVIEAIPTAGSTGGSEYQKPIEFAVSSVYPNPFNPKGQFTFDLPEDGLVTIRVFNLIGQEMGVLRSEFLKKGKGYSQTISMGSLSTGTYLLSIEHNGSRLMQKFTVLK